MKNFVDNAVSSSSHATAVSQTLQPVSVSNYFWNQKLQSALCSGDHLLEQRAKRKQDAPELRLESIFLFLGSRSKTFNVSYQ